MRGVLELFARHRRLFAELRAAGLRVGFFSNNSSQPVATVVEKLSKFAGRVSDSGEGRWTIKAAIDEGVPVPVLTTALYERFSSRGEADYADRLLSAMRFGFGGHLEKKQTKAA